MIYANGCYEGRVKKELNVLTATQTRNKKQAQHFYVGMLLSLLTRNILFLVLEVELVFKGRHKLWTSNKEAIESLPEGGESGVRFSFDKLPI